MWNGEYAKKSVVRKILGMEEGKIFCSCRVEKKFEEIRKANYLLSRMEVRDISRTCLPVQIKGMGLDSFFSAGCLSSSVSMSKTEGE